MVTPISTRKNGASSPAVWFVRNRCIALTRKKLLSCNRPRLIPMTPTIHGPMLRIPIYRPAT